MIHGKGMERRMDTILGGKIRHQNVGKMLILTLDSSVFYAHQCYA